jgi:hypothetical protein
MTVQGRIDNSRCKCRHPCRRMIKGSSKNYACAVVFSLLSQHACLRSCRSTTASHICTAKILMLQITKLTASLGKSLVHTLFNEARTPYWIFGSYGSRAISWQVRQLSTSKWHLHRVKRRRTSSYITDAYKLFSTAVWQYFVSVLKFHRENAV